jgi:hypothetical protein
MKSRTVLVESALPYGNRLTVEKDNFSGLCACIGDFHPDDPRVTICVGTAKECYKEFRSTLRRIMRAEIARAEREAGWDPNP